jgi:hypothetical protein
MIALETASIAIGAGWVRGRDGVRVRVFVERAMRPSWGPVGTECN